MQQTYNPIEARQGQIGLSALLVAAGVSLGVALTYGIGFAVAAGLVAFGLVALVGALTAPGVTVVQLPPDAAVGRPPASEPAD